VIDFAVGEALRTYARKPYNRYLRDRLPRRIGVFNGVAVRWPRLFDVRDHVPDWKAGTISAVQAAVRPGDTVVEIGGGFGVCTVQAAREAGVSGEVYTFEASASRYDVIQETLELNDVAEQVTVRHALVGDAVDVFGPLSGAPTVDPEDVPECDVLVTDCEGAEKAVLAGLFATDRPLPRTFVVETHGFADSTTDDAAAMLREAGYTIESITPASPETDPEEDNRVIRAVEGRDDPVTVSAASPRRVTAP
jgi:hypothetical protein